MMTRFQVAQFERQLLIKRTVAGLKAAPKAAQAATVAE
jgi:hypothetical protein